MVDKNLTNLESTHCANTRNPNLERHISFLLDGLLRDVPVPNGFFRPSVGLSERPDGVDTVPQQAHEEDGRCEVVVAGHVDARPEQLLRKRFT